MQRIAAAVRVFVKGDAFVLEPIRLVIWDLDETFWSGTLTEGGISYNQANHDAVIELARRGIMSSICSKNNLEKVKAVLQDKGLWQYFIFPSVDWTAKGPRLAALVEAVQLRPETILFIDDNPMNLNEARHYVPNLQVSDETIIPFLLTNPLCRGKDDQSLTRLNQYKLLESRKSDVNSYSDTTEFLRASGIQVTIEHDIEPHYERAVELINRTNQLNFTKHRLPEDPAAAIKSLQNQLSGFMKHAGLVHVRDRYGDYGFVGFYLVRSFAGSKELEHFCFSCRTLGMGIESWLYERLGRPKLKVQGEVLTDISAQDQIDWINQGDVAGSRNGEKLAGRILVRGGCSMTSTAHYLELNADEVVGEFNIIRDTLSVRTDLSRFLRYAVEGIDEKALQMAARLGYQPQDFTSALADDPDGFDVCIFSFQIEMQSAEYRHPETGLQLPFFRILEHGDNRKNVLDLKMETSSQTAKAIEALRRHDFEFVGVDPGAFKVNLQAILSNISQKTIVFFVLAPDIQQDEQSLIEYYVNCNDVILDVAGARPNTFFLDILDFVQSRSERIDAHHFTRMVYFRLYQKIAQMLREQASGQRNAVLPPRRAAAIAAQQQSAVKLGRPVLEDIVANMYKALLQRDPDPVYLKQHCDVIEKIGLDAGLAYLAKHFVQTGGIGKAFKVPDSNSLKAAPARPQQRWGDVGRNEIEEIVVELYRNTLQRDPEAVYLKQHCDVIEEVGLDVGLVYLIKHFVQTGGIQKAFKPQAVVS